MESVGRSRLRVAVIGGGISGLTAALRLAEARQSGAPIDELVVEFNSRLGGLIKTDYIDGFTVEGGPDSFLSEKREAAALCRQLGLAADLIGSNDATRQTYVLCRSRLTALPDGMVLFAPTQLRAVLSSQLIPFSSKLIVARRYLGRGGTSASGASADADESVASFVRRHFGQGLLENVAAPLLAGVFGGSAETLSARATLGRFYEIEQKYGNLSRGILEERRRRRAGPGGAERPPLFTTLKGGLGTLVSALAARLEKPRLRLNLRTQAIECRNDGYRIHCEHIRWSPGPLAGSEERLDADVVILALPVHECARLLGVLDPHLGHLLNEISSTPSATVAAAFGREVLEKLPEGFGFLVRESENARLLACTFVHGKFSCRAPAGHALLRCFLGGSRDVDILNLSDDEIWDIARRDLRNILKIEDTPLFWRVYRWPFSMPQYTVGHQARVGAIHARLGCHRGLLLAGNAYSGVGISDCIRSGHEAAATAVAFAQQRAAVAAGT